MEKTNSGLVAYAKAQVGKPYWYGTYGQTASASLYAAQKKQYPSYYTASDFAGQYGQRVHDCNGLIKGYKWSASATGTPSYNASQDRNAAGLYRAAATKGKIDTFPKTAGLLVFKGTSTSAIHHVGVYGGDGYVYEAKSHAAGVVKTAYRAADWDYWAQDPDITDDTTSSASSSSGSATTTKTAIDSAKSFDKSLAGTYQVTASALNLRTGAGTGKTILVALPKGTKVKNYGYYTAVSGKKWLYVQTTYRGTTYTGFCSSAYLSRA